MPGREGWTEAEFCGLILPLHTRQERMKRSLELVGQRDPGLAENAGDGGVSEDFSVTTFRKQLS